MTPPEESDWARALEIAADGPPAAMTPQHMRRARTLVIAYIGLAVLGVLVANIVAGDRGGIYFATLATAAVLVVTAIRAAVNGKLARWTSPLDYLAPMDSERIRTAVYNPDKDPESGRELVRSLGRQFLFGNLVRVALAGEVAVLFGLLSMRSSEHPPLGLSLGALAVLNLVLAGMELHRRRGVRATLRRLGPDHHG